MSHDFSIDGKWLAVQVRSGHERAAGSFLDSVGYEQFVPLHRAYEPDRRMSVLKPLFPGYLFCRYIANHACRIVQAPGVMKLVGFGRGPIPIDDQEIAAIQRVSTLCLQAEPWRFVSAGQRVRIHAGPMAGMEGLLVSVKNGHRLLLSVTLLRRSVALEVDVRDIQPAQPYDLMSPPHSEGERWTSRTALS